MSATTNPQGPGPEGIGSPQEKLLYILDMVEQLANIAARNSMKELASDLFVVCAEARRRYISLQH